MLDRRGFVTIALAILMAITPTISRAGSNPQKRIVIDPGHGGADWGATDGEKEKDAVLAIGLQVAKILEAHGVKAILTRSGDYFIGLNERVEISNRARADAFVSIHANYFENAEAMGVETYTYGQDNGLARSVQDAIISQVAAVDRGVKVARFLVLRKSSIPAILVETGFISNKIEGALLSTPEYRNRMADAIAKGILKYLGIEYRLVRGRAIELDVRSLQNP